MAEKNIDGTKFWEMLLKSSLCSDVKPTVSDEMKKVLDIAKKLTFGEEFIKHQIEKENE